MAKRRRRRKYGFSFSWRRQVGDDGLPVHDEGRFIALDMQEW